MSLDESHRILLKVLEYVFITSNNDKATENIFPIEIGVQFPVLESTATLSQIAVYIQSVCLHPFDVQYFSKVMREEKNGIKNLQSKINDPCLCVKQYMDGICTHFTFYYSDCLSECCNNEENMNENHGQLLIKSIEETKCALAEELNEEKFQLSIFLNVNNLQSTVPKLESFTLNFMKKCQIMNPFFSITYSTSLTCKRLVMNGCQNGKKRFLENITSYLRNVTAAELITPVHSAVKKIPQNSGNSSVSIFYTCAENINIGKKNHFHILFFSKQGLPLNTDRVKWHSVIQIGRVEKTGITIEPASDCSDVTDVCYKISGMESSVFYLAIFLVENFNVLEDIVEHNSSLVTTFLIGIVRKMVSISETWEKDKMYSKMVASSLSSIIRFSENSEFREQCLHLLQARDSMDAEVKLEEMLMKQLLPQ